MRDFKESPEWNFGRRGEFLIMATLIERNFIVQDISGSADQKAPLILGKQATISPDLFAWLRKFQLLECKTKLHCEHWRGGSPDDVPKINARMEQGMDESAYRGYLDASKKCNSPVIVAFLAVEDHPDDVMAGSYLHARGRGGVLLVQALHLLPKPRFSPHPVFPLVSWDVRDFKVLAEFDRNRLWDYFFKPRVGACPANCVDHAGRRYRLLIDHDVPNIGKLRQLYAAMRPKQDEFEEVQQHFAGVMEDWWHGKRGRAAE